MTDMGDKLADAAAGLIGAPFRLGGCSKDHGLDCVGLVACALRELGINAQRPIGYSLRNTSVTAYLHLAQANGFALTNGILQRGDLLLVQPGPAQHHLAIANGGNRFIHAHAGLRQVIIGELPASWPVLKRWRLTSLIKG